MFKILISAQEKMPWGYSFTAETEEETNEMVKDFEEAGWYVYVMFEEMFTERWSKHFPAGIYQ